MTVNRLLISLMFLSMPWQAAVSQSTETLFMTKSLKRAYEAGTRSITGKPGKNYWQNYSHYNIYAELIPAERKITGKERITYYNNSPDTLKVLYFNLYQDLYKKGTARDWDLGPDDITEGVNIEKINIEGKAVDLKSKTFRRASIMRVSLPSTVAPGAFVSLDLQWSLVLPAKQTVRMGTYHGSSFMAAYWYPKIAVYDDVYGWDTDPYTGNCEFYNDFSDYDVTIKAPANYILLSSGILQNGREIFKSKIRQKLERAYSGDDVVNIVGTDDRAGKDIFKTQKSHLWHFKIDSMPDFAFAASDKYLWDATSVSTGERRVLINTFYAEESLRFRQVAQIASEAIAFFSTKIPAIPYPFPQLTVFNGHGGMEFPAMVNDGESRSLSDALYVTSHEIGHGYFPFYTGLNEELYAWMDEGMITFLPRFFMADYMKDTGKALFAKIIKSYNSHAGGKSEIPLMVPSTNTGSAYRYQAYTKSSTAFYLLFNYLGKEKFTRGLRLFVSRWNHKHPTPFDFFYCMNEAAGEDLGWFWQPWFFTMKYADLSVEKSGDNGFIIRNKGGLPVPVHLTIVFDNGRTDTLNKAASLWRGGKKSFAGAFDNAKIKKLILDTKTTPDVFPGDNVAE